MILADAAPSGTGDRLLGVSLATPPAKHREGHPPPCVRTLLRQPDAS